MGLYVVADYVAPGYAEVTVDPAMISINWGTKVIFVPREFLTWISGTNYELDTDAFRIALKDLEESEDGILFPDTHIHKSATLLGGIEYAQIIEIINGYTITFEDGQYAVTLIGSNNNILDVVNLNQVSFRSNNSAGLIQTREIQQASFEGRVTVNTNGMSGTLYPTGTGIRPVNNMADAKLIAANRGLTEFFLQSNYIIPSALSDPGNGDLTALRFAGRGATMNTLTSAHTKVTLNQDCVTLNTHWTDCVITGYQGGESVYEDCVIDGLENAHCLYLRCGIMDGTGRGYSIKLSSTVSAGHLSYYRNCYSDEGVAVIDYNGAAVKTAFDGFHGNLKIINLNRVGGDGAVDIHLNGGTVTVDASCTTGKVTITGSGTLVNHSGGSAVDTTGFLAENFEQLKISVESVRDTHQAFGVQWFVDPINGSDSALGTSTQTPVRTVTKAIQLAVSGRGDVIYIRSPGAGVTSIDERIVINKEALHIRGPGRGVEFTPLSGSGPVITVDANYCSLTSFLVRAQAGSLADDCIVVNGDFCRMAELYPVGSNTGTGHGVHLRGGSYHLLDNLVIEKCGGDGVRFTDAGLGTGSPRDVTITGCDIYINKGNGITYTGTSSNSTRYNRIHDCSISNNLGYGIDAQALTQHLLIGSSVELYDNALGDVNDLASDTDDMRTPLVTWQQPEALRALGLLHENGVIDNPTYSGTNKLLTARLRKYDTKANAQAAGATGLLYTWTIITTYDGNDNMATYKLVRE